MATLSNIVRALHAIKQGAEWCAFCPAHNDRKPSLSLTNKHGKITFYCQAGCSQAEVANALADLGLWGKTYAHRDSRRQRGKPIIRKPAGLTPLGPIVAEYNYTDESGTLLYQVTRHEPKDFRQRRPDGKGGWCPGLKYVDGTLAVRPVLYNLPEVIANDIIFVVEGEKDCETLRDHGFVGTTNSSGAWLVAR